MRKLSYFVFIVSLCFFIKPSADCADFKRNFGDERMIYDNKNSLRAELISLDRQIARNQMRINSIRSSRNLSENEKRRKIIFLESQNRYLKRKINRIKSQYKRPDIYSRDVRIIKDVNKPV